MPPRKRRPLDRAQLAPQIRQPGPSPLAAEMQPVDPKDWDLVVAIRIVDGEATAQVHGRRTRRLGKALRIVAAQTEQWEEP